MQSMMIDKVKKSPAVEIMRDGIVKQMAAIINMPDDMTDSSKASDYSEIASYVGRPFTIFENYAITNGASGQMIIILSGQTTPVTRISKMADIVKSSKELRDKQKKFNLREMIADSSTKSNIPDFLKDSNPDTEAREAQLKNFFDNL